MKKKIVTTTVSLALAGALLAGCGSSGGDSGAASSAGGSTGDAAATESATQASDTASAASGGDLNVMLDTPVESLDPQLASDYTSDEVISQYTDGLMQIAADGTVAPAIAESYEISEDGLTYTFHLRDDAKWSNGDPVTANDFVFAWQRLVDPDVASEYSYMMSDIAQVKNAADIVAGTKDKSELGVTAVDDTTLRVELNVPVSYFLSLTNFPTFYPVEESFFESCGDTFATSPETTLSNGAFILDDYQPAATTLHLSKNPDYYDADRVKLSGLSYQVVQDSQQALMIFQTGDLDVIKISGEQIDQVKDDPEYYVTTGGFLWYVSPNISGVPELANEDIRRALTFAIDRESITNDVLRDGSAATYTPVPKEVAYGPDGSDFSEDISAFADDCGYDTQKAADYWASGLAALGEDSVTLDMVVDSDDAPQKVAQVLKDQWETNLPGLTVNLVVEPKKQRVQDMQEGNYQLGLTRWGPDYADPMTYLGMWVTGNSNNYGLWSNADYDAMIAECTTGDLATDPQGRWDRLHDAEKIIMDEAVILPVYTSCDSMMISSKVTGIGFHSAGATTVYKDVVKSE